MSCFLASGVKKSPVTNPRIKARLIGLSESISEYWGSTSVFPTTFSVPTNIAARIASMTPSRMVVFRLNF